MAEGSVNDGTVVFISIFLYVFVVEVVVFFYICMNCYSLMFSPLFLMNFSSQVGLNSEFSKIQLSQHVLDEFDCNFVFIFCVSHFQRFF